MNTLNDRLAAKLAEREAGGSLRKLTLKQLPTDFVSNDYLGLASKGILNEFIRNTLVGAPSPGATGSRLLSGNFWETEQLERDIAAFFGAETALLFNSGYNANIGLLQSITGKHTLVLYDELCHASLIDGIRLALSPHKYRFAHNDCAALEEKLRQFSGLNEIIVVVESVYSMDGDTAPLALITEICKKYNAQLIVDEAHATGVIGSQGEGLVNFLGLRKDVFATVHTFGKALGCHGAVVVGSNLLRSYLINFSRAFIYTTALPPAAIKAAAAAFRYLNSPSFTNGKLHENISYFRTKTKQSGIAGWKDSTSAVQALVIGNNTACHATANALQAAGLDVRPILAPTIPEGKERIRVCLHSFNTFAEIDTLFEICISEASCRANNTQTI
jgi:8-amino-7-oxononanoate synthase